MLSRRVPSDVGETPIQGHDHAPFTGRRLGDNLVAPSAQPFGDDHAHVVPTLFEKPCCPPGRILVQLKLH
jgi:hypothetical protein